MKRSLPLFQTTPLMQEFISRWRLKKNYPQSAVIDITDCLEILVATPAFHAESSLYGTFNFVLELKEFQLGYDGDEPLDILVYYLEQYLKERLRKISATIAEKEVKTT